MLDYPQKAYARGQAFAKRVRTDKDFRWRVFQSLRLPISVKKARVQSKKYNGTVLITSTELMRIANKFIVPKLGDSLMAGNMNMNSYFVGAGINNYKYGITLSRNELYHDCLKQLDFAK